MPLSVYICAMARAATTTDVFNAVGDPTRRRIIELLVAGESTVGDLVDALSLPQPRVSKHLRVLRDVDVVRCRESGRQRLYCVRLESLRPMDAWLAQLTSTVNANFDRLDDYLAELQPTPKQETK